METKVLLKPAETEYTAHMSEAFTMMAAFPKDVIIASAENEQIKVNRMLLSVYSPTMTPFLLSSSTIILPDCSTKSIKILISIITRGFTTNECSSTFDIDDILEVVDTGKILGIKVKNLKADLICNESSDKSKDKNVPEGTIEEAVVIDSITDKNNLNEKVAVYKQMVLNQNHIYNYEIKEKTEDLEPEILNQEDIKMIKDEDDLEDSFLSISEFPDKNVDNLEELMKDVDNMINNSVSIPSKSKSNKTQFIDETDASDTEIRSDPAQDHIESMDLNSQYSDLSELRDQYVDNLEEIMKDIDSKSKSNKAQFIDETDASDTEIRSDPAQDNIESMDLNSQYSDLSELTDQYVDNLEEMMKDVDNMIDNSLNIPSRSKSIINEFIDETHGHDNDHNNIERMDLISKSTDLAKVQNIISPCKTIDSPIDFEKEIEKIRSNILNITEESQEFCNTMSDVITDDGYPNEFSINVSGDKPNTILEYSGNITGKLVLDSDISDSVPEVLMNDNNGRICESTKKNSHFIDDKIEDRNAEKLCQKGDSNNYINSDVIPDNGYPIDKLSKNVSGDKPNTILVYRGNLNGEEDFNSHFVDDKIDLRNIEQGCQKGDTNKLVDTKSTKKKSHTKETFETFVDVETFVDDTTDKRNTDKNCQKGDTNKYFGTDVISDDGYPNDKLSKIVSGEKPNTKETFETFVDVETFVDGTTDKRNTDKNCQKGDTNKYFGTDVIPDDGYPNDKFSKIVPGEKPNAILEYSGNHNGKEDMDSDISDPVTEILMNENNVKNGHSTKKNSHENETSVDDKIGEKNTPNSCQKEDTNKYVGTVTSDSELTNDNAKKIIIDCQICGKHFNLKIAIANVAMEYHYAIHHFKEDLLAFTDIIKGAKCIPCEKMFARMDNALVHVGVFHGKLDLLLSDKGLRKLRKSQSSAKEKSSTNNGSGTAFDTNKHHTDGNKVIMEETYKLDKNLQECLNVDVRDSTLQILNKIDNKSRDTICESKIIEVIDTENISQIEGPNENVNTASENVELTNGITEKISNRCQICNKDITSHFNLEYHYVMIHFKEDILTLECSGILNGKKCIPCDKTFINWGYALTHVGGFHNKLDLLLSNKGLKKLRKPKRSAKGKLNTNDEYENLSEGGKPADAQNIQTVFQNDNSLDAKTNIHSNRDNNIKAISHSFDWNQFDGNEVIMEETYNLDKNRDTVCESKKIEVINPENISQLTNENVNTASENVELNNGFTADISNQCQICHKHFNPKIGIAKFSLQYHYAIHHFKKDLSADLLNGEKCILCDKTFSRWDNALVHVGGFHNKLDKLLSNKGLQKLRKSKFDFILDSDIMAGEDNGNIDTQGVFKHNTNDTETIIEDPYNSDKNLNNTSKKSLQESLTFKLSDPNITNAEDVDQREIINNGIDCQICNKHFRRHTNLGYHYGMFHFKQDLLMLKDFISEKRCIPCDKIFTRKYVVIMHVGIYHKKINLLLSNKGLRKLKQTKLSTKKLGKEHMKRQKLGDISIKKKRKFSKEQISLLTTEFDKCEIMTNSICTSLANRTGLKTKQIRNLFKIKKDMRRPKNTSLVKIAGFDKSEILNESSSVSLANSTGLKRKQTRQSVKNEANKRKHTLSITDNSIESHKSFDETKLIESNYFDKSITLDGSISIVSDNFNEQNIKIKDMTPEQKRAYLKKRAQIRNEKYCMPIEAKIGYVDRSQNNTKVYEPEVSENFNKKKIKVKDMTPEQKRAYYKQQSRNYLNKMTPEQKRAFELMSDKPRYRAAIAAKNLQRCINVTMMMKTTLSTVT